MWNDVTPDHSATTFWEKSPFGLFAEKIFKSVEEKNKELQNPCKLGVRKLQPNIFYKLEFLSYIKVYVAPYFPIVSHFVFDVCGIPAEDDTTNVIEAHHKVLKQDYLHGEDRIKISRFIRKQAVFIKGTNMLLNSFYRPKILKLPLILSRYIIL